MERLPVEEVLNLVTAALDAGRAAVVQAPPGAGKTTRVPPALLDRSWRGDGRIVVTEPRRLAARAAARAIARVLGEEVGETAGYVTRDDRRVSAATRIEVVTEGVLVRRLQRDPALTGVAAVVFDEFHERSLDADLGLALTLEVRDALRPDLRLAVMSATLDGARVATLLGDAERISSQGRRHPVDTRYRPRPLRQPVSDAVADAVLDVLGETEGDVLAFLPGAADIRRAARSLLGRVGPGVVVAPLFGALPPRDQDLALDPSPSGARKVVLATDIAETSLTIDGVRVVVDGGLARVPRFDPRTGMSGLSTVRVSRAGADQRRGRAGRTAPGLCVRLWSEREQSGMPPFREPEIVQADLTGFALEVAAWGAAPDELRLLDPPPAPSLVRSQELLVELGALDDERRITDHGRALAALPVHPRIAHMLHRARDLGLDAVAVEVAALLADRDLLTTTADTSESDVVTRIHVLRGDHGPPAGARVRRGSVARARREAQRLRRAVPPGNPDGHGEAPAGADHAGMVLALAYPERVAALRGGRGRFLLANGRGATLPVSDPLAGERWLVVADVDEGDAEARIRLAAAVERDQLRTVLAHRIVTEDVVEWDHDRGDVVAETRERLGQVVLGRAPLRHPADGATTAALLDGIRAAGLDLLPWDRDLRDLQARVAFVRGHVDATWPDVSDDALLADLERWLGPFLAGLRRRSDIDRVPLRDALVHRLGRERHRRLDDLAPTHLRVPSGSTVRLDYHDQGGVPVLAVKLQEMFGATETPRIGGGAVPVVVHLLSPARRPVQVTVDLAGFWERIYPQVRAELRGRYPRHPWPQDPSSATPTARTKPRS